MKCCVVSCKSYTEKQEPAIKLSFHRFPGDKNLRQNWIDAIKRGPGWAPSKYSKICSLHFDDEYFYKTKKGLIKLRYGAIPTYQLEPKTNAIEEFKQKYGIVVNRDLQSLDEAMNTTEILIVNDMNKVTHTVNNGLIQEIQILKPADVSEQEKNEQDSMNQFLKINDTPREKALKHEIHRLKNREKTLIKKVKRLEMANKSLKRKVEEQADKPEFDPGIICNNCIGVQFLCVQCAEVKLCGMCEHPHHFILRIPETQPQCEIDEMLFRLHETIEQVLLECTGPGISEPEMVNPETGDVEDPYQEVSNVCSHESQDQVLINSPLIKEKCIDLDTGDIIEKT